MELLEQQKVNFHEIIKITIKKILKQQTLYFIHFLLLALFIAGTGNEHWFKTSGISLHYLVIVVVKIS